MRIDLELSNEGVEAAVLTMVLAACADFEMSDQEAARLRDVVVRRTSWADDKGADALIAAAQARVRELAELGGDLDELRRALAPVGERLGSVSKRESVLALAVQVASSDGLDDDERFGIDLLVEAFGADPKRVKELAGVGDGGPP